MSDNDPRVEEVRPPDEAIRFRETLARILAYGDGGGQ